MRHGIDSGGQGEVSGDAFRAKWRGVDAVDVGTHFV
jgi:hypothetical protein